MKIAWCHNGLAGGEKRATYEFVRELSRRGHLIDEYVVSHHPHTDSFPLNEYVKASYRVLLRKAEQPKLRPYLLSTGTYLVQSLMEMKHNEHIVRAAAMQMNRRGYDAVHIDHNPRSGAAGLLPFLNPPTVVYSHEASGARYGINVAEHSIKRPPVLQRLYERACRLPLHIETILINRQQAGYLRHVRHVATNSSYSQRAFMERFHRSAIVIPCGVSTQQFRPLSLPVERMVLSVGRLVPAKQHHVVIESAGLIDLAHRPRVVVASPKSYWRPSYRDHLYRLAKERAVPLEVLFDLSPKELVKLYNKALAVIFVPLMEPFGLVALEAMACGTPVIGVREGGIQESVVDGVTGMLVERNSAQIAQAIELLQNDDGVRRRMSEQAVAHIRRHWTWEQAALRYEQEMLSSGASTAGFQ